MRIFGAQFILAVDWHAEGRRGAGDGRSQFQRSEISGSRTGKMKDKFEAMVPLHAVALVKITK